MSSQRYLTVIAFAFIAGLTVSCANSASSNSASSSDGAKPIVTSKVDPKIEPNVDRANSQTAQADSEAPIVTVAVPLTENMPYAEARKTLLERGWQPSTKGDRPNLNSSAVKALYEVGYTEIKDCAGTGEGLCRFEFENRNGDVLVVVGAPNGNHPTDRSVRRWWFEEPQDAADRVAIAEGYYSLGGTDEGLEVRGDRFRYYDESETEKPWQPTSKLKVIKSGVVFDGSRYWCLSTMPPNTAARACSANGWVTERSKNLPDQKQSQLPFVGSRSFNFLGGSGTGHTIAIDANGSTTVTLNGTANRSVLYKGQFSNPLPLQDGFGLRFQEGKVYQLGKDGQLTRGCKLDEVPCVSELYE